MLSAKPYIDIESNSEFSSEKEERWPGQEEPEEEKEEKAIKSGDLVSWKAQGRTQAGVVKEIKPDGSCVVNVPTTGGSREEKVPLDRLEVLTPAPKK